MIQKKPISKSLVLDLIKHSEGDLDLFTKLINELDDIQVIKVQGGQIASYKDSIYEFIVQSYLHEEQVEELCKLYCRNSTHKVKNGNFNGSCSFPFGLESFYKFERIGYGVYRYIVCEPYTG